jgi:hypothetical protein
MEKLSEEKSPSDTLPAAGKTKLVFRGVVLASILVLVLCSCLRLLFSTGQNAPADGYLRTLILVSAFGFSFAGWGLFFLDIMCGFLKLAQAKLLTSTLDFFLALLSLLPLALALAAQRLASGIKP